MQKTQLMELMLNIWKVTIAMKNITEINYNSKQKNVLSLHLNHLYPLLANTVFLTNILKFK